MQRERFVLCYLDEGGEVGGSLERKNGRMAGIAGHGLELEPNPHGLQNIGLFYSVALALLIRGPKEQAESVRDVATAFVICIP